ncbi:MAG: hypothetical protein IIT46_05250, partial [Lachnospiraceae bacterium]|nr:hypothetical protein [Lachnospiraceae bacterium]
MKKHNKLISIILSLVLILLSVLPADSTINASVTAFTRKKAYVLTDSAKIKKITCEGKTEKLRYPKRKLVINIKKEKKYVIKYVTVNNKKKTLYLYADWTKPS